jgi:hypothetical protein
LILNFVIFIWNWLFKGLIIFWYWLNIILANIIFIALIAIMIYWIYKASIWEHFSIWLLFKASKNISLDINNDNKFDEKDKLTIVASYIPFIWYIVWAKYDNKLIQNILTFNLFIWVVITLIYILWYWNVSTIFVLIYIIYAVFVWVNLFARDELTNISLPYYFSPNWKIILQKNIIKYLRHYIKWDFKEFDIITKESKLEKEESEKKESEEVNNLRSIKIPEFLIYIPIVNLFTIFLKENNYKLHIRNWLIITFISILISIFIILWYITAKVLLLVLFPICFGLGYIKTKYYKMPYIYELFILFEKIKWLFIKSKKELKQKHNEVNEVNLQVK